MSKQLDNVQYAVARELAIGIPLETICEARKLEFTTWEKVIRGNIFKAEVERLRKEYEEQFLQDAATDPVVLTMRANALQAVKRLAIEVNNTEKEQGATATTRIAASNSLLDRMGYNKGQKEQEGVIHIHISEAKLETLKQQGKVEVAPLPAQVATL